MLSPSFSVMLTLSVVEPREIKTLYRRFRRLDRGGRGTISTDDLLMIPEVAMNPIAPRLTSLFERDAEDRINFKDFVTGLSFFSERARPDVRKRVVFRLYDMDGDGAISEADLRALLQLLVGSSWTTATLDRVISATMLEADKDKDGRISYEDFEQARRSLAAVSWEMFSVPVLSSSRWEARLNQVTQSPSLVKLSD